MFETVLFRRALLVLLAIAGTVLGTGCATTEGQEPPPPTAPGVSNIPWNRPERWEGTGGIPGIPSPGSY